MFVPVAGNFRCVKLQINLDFQSAIQLEFTVDFIGQGLLLAINAICECNAFYLNGTLFRYGEPNADFA